MRRSGLLLLTVWLCLVGVAWGDYLEVRRASTIKTEPRGDADILIRPEVGQNLVLVSGDQTDGYYEVEIPADHGAAESSGWIYRSLVRRFPGLAPEAEAETGLTPAELSLLEATAITWPARHDTSPSPHTVFGVPQYNDDDDEFARVGQRYASASRRFSRPKYPRLRYIRSTQERHDHTAIPWRDSGTELNLGILRHFSPAQLHSFCADSRGGYAHTLIWRGST